MAQNPLTKLGKGNDSTYVWGQVLGDGVLASRMVSWGCHFFWSMQKNAHQHCIVEDQLIRSARDSFLQSGGNMWYSCHLFTLNPKISDV